LAGKNPSSINGIPAGKPIPKTPPDPHPVADRNSPINPQNAVIDLAAMSPKRFSQTLELCGDKALKLLLARECSKPGPKQDSGVIAKLYKELKRRGA
jgi:hypothetical protein